MFVIRPNSSLSWRGNLIFLGLLSVLSFGIAGVFAWLGYWMVLPFAGLEMGVLALALYLCAWRAQRCEVVTVAADHVHVAIGHGRPERHERFDRHWVKVTLEAVGREDRSRLLLRSHGRELEIGACLPEDERRTLAIALRRAIELPPPEVVGAQTGSEHSLQRI